MTKTEAEKHWRELGESKADWADKLEALRATLEKPDAFYDLEIEAARYQSREAFNVAESLRLERETGVPHCCCKTPPHPKSDHR